MVDKMLSGDAGGGQDSGPPPSENGHKVVPEVQRDHQGGISEGEVNLQGSGSTSTIPFHVNDLRREQRKETVTKAWNNLVGILGVEGHPLRILDFAHLLHPYYEYRFNTIPTGVWAWVQEEAKRMLEEDKLHPKVEKHLRKIVNGEVPFGLNLEGED